MERRPSPDDDDDDFDDIYKEYTGPPVLTVANAPEKAKPSKRSHASSEEDEEPHDPNAVPTDFTSREAKVWEAKSKATERNWKKRKEEEMICKICGESGHFTQGCPSTLGANRKSQDFIERVVARDKHVKALFTERVIQKIEKDNGCKFKMEEKFIIVSGKDRLVLAKGVDAVHKIIKEEGSRKDPVSPHLNRSRSPERSPGISRFGRSEPQRSLDAVHKVIKEEGSRKDHVSPHLNSSRSPERNPDISRFGRSEPQRSFTSPQRSQSQQRFVRQEKIVEDRVREDLQKMSRCSSQGNEGSRSRSSHSKSPAPHPYIGNSYVTLDGRSPNMGVYKTEKWHTEREGPDMRYARKPDYDALPKKTLEEIELEYKREAMELSRNRDKEEDEENYKHREAVREIRESYMKKLAIVRDMHAKQWEHFLQLDAQMQQRKSQQISSPGYGGSYKQHAYTQYDNRASADPHYVGGNNVHVDSRSRYSNSAENSQSSRPHDNYVDFHRPRREDYEKTYNRY